eukprot:SAG31_NODE_383_length_16451_cov_8.412977_3_plen_123_part_00
MGKGGGTYVGKCYLHETYHFVASQNPPHMDINMHLSNINADLVALHTDLVHLGLWESTTIVTISDFGRTITSNGIGTDHGWGGNNFIAGGAVKGGRIHGHFPDDLNPATSGKGLLSRFCATI